MFSKSILYPWGTRRNVEYNIKNIYIYGDSNARDLAKIIINKTSKIKAQAIIKPGAPFSEIVKNISVVGKDDCIILQAGSNDIRECCTLEAMHNLKRLIQRRLQTLPDVPLIFLAIPLRWDTYKYNIHINYVNDFIEELATKLVNVLYVDINKELNRNSYSERGNNINMNGKKQIAKAIISKLKYI